MNEGARQGNTEELLLPEQDNAIQDNEEADIM